AMGRDIDVRIAPSAGDFSVTGQVLGPDRAGTVEMIRRTMADADKTHRRVADLDDLGEFRIDGLPAGQYTLTLRVADVEIELPPSDVGSPRG
ncbi:MAG TPA: hypothetical protein VF814_19525, partial [Casimicrobiaceae bacterium]